MKRAARALAPIFVTAICGALACGDDVSAEDACGQVVESYARAWERCGRDTYEDALRVFQTAFACDQQKNVNQDKLGQCVDDVNGLDCAAVGNGQMPGSCSDVVGD